MRYIIVVLVCVLLSGCDIQKEASKRKTETSLSEDWEQREFRPSAEVRYSPPANVILRDTTIVIVNSEGSKIKLQYDEKGVMREAECLPALIDLVTKMSKQFDQSEKEKQKSKTEEFSSTWILYIVIGLAVAICFGFFLTFKTITKNSAALTAILDKIGNT